MKKYFSLFTFAALITLLSTSCNSDQGYMKAVSKDAPLVMKVNFGQLLEKSEVMEMKEVKNVIKEIKNSADKDTRNLVSEVLDDPNSFGIDINSPAVFAVNDAAKAQFVLVAKVASKGDLDDHMKQIDEMSGGKMDIDYDGITTIKISKSMKVAYDSNAFVISWSANYNSAADDPDKLLQQDESESLLSVDNASDFINCNDDFAMFINYAGIADMDRNLKKSMSAIPGLDEMAALWTANFDKGEVVSNMKTYASKEMMELIEKCYKDATGKFIEMAPENSFIVFQGGIGDLSAVFEMMDPSVLKQANKEMKHEVGLTMEEILQSINGDFLFAAYEGETEVPDFVVAMECDNKLWKLIEDKVLSQAGLNKTSDGYDLNGMYLNYKDGGIVFNKGNIYKGSKNFTKSPYASYVSKCGMVLDCNEFIKVIDKTNGNDCEINLVKNMLSLCKVITMEKKSNSEIEAKAIMTKNNDNALKTLIIDGFKIAQEYNECESERWNKFWEEDYYDPYAEDSVAVNYDELEPDNWYDD